MKVKDVIKSMQNYNPEDEVIILWWTKDIFDDEDNTISDDVWSNVVKEVNDNHLDYSSQVISEDILNVLVEHGVYYVDPSVDYCDDCNAPMVWCICEVTA